MQDDAGSIDLGGVLGGPGGLRPGGWGEAEWRRLLAVATVRRLRAGEAAIRRGGTDRVVYVVLGGELEVMAHGGDGMSMGPIARIGPGGVVGEKAFFDGAPRMAGAWAVTDCVLAGISPEAFAAFAAANPGLACDVLLALGRVLAERLQRNAARGIA